MQGMVINGFVNAVISSLEQRFGLKSTETGVIAGSYDIGSMLSVIPITYFGGRVGASKPKYISWGLLLMGFGSLMFALPHFTTDVYLSQQVKIGNTSDTTGLIHFMTVLSTRWRIDNYTKKGEFYIEKQS